MSVPGDDPTTVGEDTLRAFESELRGAAEAEPASSPRRNRQGPMLLIGMALSIAVGAAVVVGWLL